MLVEMICVRRLHAEELGVHESGLHPEALPA